MPGEVLIIILWYLRRVPAALRRSLYPSFLYFRDSDDGGGVGVRGPLPLHFFAN